MTTLAAINEQLVSANKSQDKTTEEIKDLKSMIGKMLAIDEETLDQQKRDRMDELERLKKESRKKAPAPARDRRPTTFRGGLAEGLGVTPVAEMIRSFGIGAMGGMFSGATAAAVGKAAGNLIRKGGAAGLAFAFADDAIAAAFDYLKDKGIDFNLTQEQENEIADRTGTGIGAYLLASIFKINPFAKLAVAVSTAFSDKIIGAVKNFFGIKDNENGEAIATLPFMGEVNLNDPEVQKTAVGVTATVTMLALAMVNRARKAAERLGQNVADGMKTPLAYAGRGTTVETPGERLAYMKKMGYFSKAPTGAFDSIAMPDQPISSDSPQIRMSDFSEDLVRFRGQGFINGSKVYMPEGANARPLIDVDGATRFASKAEVARALNPELVKRAANVARFAKALGVVGTAIDAYRIYDILNDPTKSQRDKEIEIAAMIGALPIGVGGAILGGAAAGTVFGAGPWGTFFGALAGGGAFAIGGEYAIRKALARYMMDGSTETPRLQSYGMSDEEYQKWAQTVNTTNIGTTATHMPGMGNAAYMSGANEALANYFGGSTASTGFGQTTGSDKWLRDYYKVQGFRQPLRFDAESLLPPEAAFSGGGANVIGQIGDNNTNNVSNQVHIGQDGPGPYDYLFGGSSHPYSAVGSN